MRAAYLVIAHGSREKEANDAFFEFLGRFRKIYPGRLVEGAFLELAKPAIPEAIETCFAKGAREIFVIPLMLFPGRHVKDHIPKIIEEARVRHPDADFHCAGPLAGHPLLLDLVGEVSSSLTAKMRRKI